MARTQCLAGRGLSLLGSLAILSWYYRMWAVLKGILEEVFGGILGEVFFRGGGGVWVCF